MIATDELPDAVNALRGEGPRTTSYRGRGARNPRSARKMGTPLSFCPLYTGIDLLRAQSELHSGVSDSKERRTFGARPSALLPLTSTIDDLCNLASGSAWQTKTVRRFFDSNVLTLRVKMEPWSAGESQTSQIPHC
jgi:hypothetical protein